MFLPINYLLFSFLFFISAGSEEWGGICQLGKRQSPINIKLEFVKLKNYAPFKFHESYYTKRQISVKNNGHTIQVSIQDNFTKPFVYGGDLNGKYVFEQLHFHWESEHEFEGKRADLEMHLVHFNGKYQSFSEAVTKPDGLAVFAVLFDISNKTDYEIENFFHYLTKSIFQKDFSVPEIPQIHNLSYNNNFNAVNNIEKDSFSLRHFLPKQTTRFFRYDGSLTTPFCNEVVKWTIFTNRFPISNKVINILRSIPDHRGNLLSHNYRPPQSLNGRNVYLQILNSDKGEENGSNNTNSINLRLSIYFVCVCVFIHLKLII